MSFMFNPYPYEDDQAVNRPHLPWHVLDSIVWGTDAVLGFLGDLPQSHAGRRLRSGAYLLALDGYVGIDWDEVVSGLRSTLESRHCEVALYDMSTCYQVSSQLDQMFVPYLSANPQKDPVGLFGRLFEGDITDLYDPAKVKALIATLQQVRGRPDSPTTPEMHIVYGCGAAAGKLADLYDAVVYCDLTAYQVVRKVLAGKLRNLGDAQGRSRREVFRRLYYVDYEVVGRLRARLLQEGRIDYYIDCNRPAEWRLLPRPALDSLCKALTQYPLRCKPCYIEGVWGGTFFKRLRHLPEQMRNCAWVFDLIPNEVSLVVEVDDRRLEVPFTTFVRKEGVALMGQECAERFGGAFPVRVNYDDTYHSAGNMSLQVHPPGPYSREQFGEPWGQDESYYVVATGHDAKTYLGFKDGVDVEAFLAGVQRSERERIPVEYDQYLHSIPSKPGEQFLIPAGTIHASGRNQVVLEVGSLTVGSYTFKLYDYLRLDLDGNPRPIHSWHGSNVARRERTATWVAEQIHQRPRRLRGSDSWAEYAIGEQALMYFGHHRLEFEREIEDDTGGRFHILVLVDGERVLVQAMSAPEKQDELHFLDVVLGPAALGKYVIRNLGNQPVCMHKTFVREL